MKILLIDIETSPNTAHVWGLWNQNINTVQLLDSSQTLCFSAKWYGSDDVIFESVYNTSHEAMVCVAHMLLDEADAVIHYNGTRFDIPTLNKEFLLLGLPPPAPYKQIDLLRVARNQFKFPSNKLDYIAQALGVGSKHKGISYQTWLGCLNNDPESWATMEQYNKQDVIILEGVYEHMKPWIKNHANHSLYEDALVCPNCGGHNFQRRGTHITNALRYQRYQCTDCGNWFKGGKALGPKPDGKFSNI